MKNESNKEDLIVNLTIEGTEYQEIEVTVSDPNKTIREQIDSIVRVFELPTYLSNGLPRQYLLGLFMQGEEEPVILDFEDEEGNQQSIMDYNIKNGDHLHLIQPPLYGCTMDDVEEVDSSADYDKANVEENRKTDEPFWRHILYGCWL